MYNLLSTQMIASIASGFLFFDDHSVHSFRHSRYRTYLDVSFLNNINLFNARNLCTEHSISRRTSLNRQKISRPSPQRKVKTKENEHSLVQEYLSARLLTSYRFLYSCDDLENYIRIIQSCYRINTRRSMQVRDFYILIMIRTVHIIKTTMLFPQQVLI